MNEFIEKLLSEYGFDTGNGVGKFYNGNAVKMIINKVCQAQRNACQQVVEHYGSHSELDSIEQLYEAVGNAEIDGTDYLASKKPRYLLVRHFDTQPLLTVPTIELAHGIADKLKPWVVDIEDLDVEHYSYIPEDSDIENIAKKNGYVSPITGADYE